MANRPFVIPMSTTPPHGDDELGTNKRELDSVGGLQPKLFFDRYGILENPFGVTPNPRYLYQSNSHAKARAALITGIECGLGFQALIAPPGMGKTTILFDLLQRFDKVALTAFLFHNHRTFRDFSRCLISELGGEAHDSDPVGMQDTIVQLLIRERRAGRQTIIIIDEAQNLNASVLETVRLLSNFETSAEKLVQIVLAGQPKLAQRLISPDLAQLQQRISTLTTLIPFNLEDTTNYIEHRLIVAGYNGPPLFTSAAVRLIWECSGGVPRKINTLCFNALLLAGTAECKQVDSGILHEVVEDLDLDRIRVNIGTPPRGMQTTNGLPLGNTAEDSPETSVDKGCQATVSGAEAKSDDAFAPPTAFDEVDLVELRKIAAKRDSTRSGEKAEHAAVSGANTEADYASIRPTPFDAIDLVELRKIGPKIGSTGNGNNLAQPAVPYAGLGSNDRIGPVLPQDTPALAGHQKTDISIVADTVAAGVPRRETEASGSSTDILLATLEALAAEAQPAPKARHDLSSGVESKLTWMGIVGPAEEIKPDSKIEIKPESRLDVELTPKAEPGVTAGVPRREKEASSNSTDVLQATLEATADEAEPVPKVRHDLSLGVESKLTSKGEVDRAAGTTLDPKIEIKPERLGAEWPLKAEPGVRAGVPRREKEASSSSPDALQAALEALAAEAEPVPKAKPDLSAGVESKLTSKGQVDYAARIKPNPKVETKPESGLGVELTPRIEPGVAVTQQCNIIAEPDAVSEAVQKSLWKTVTKHLSWRKQLLVAHRTTIYLVSSVLIFLLGLSYATLLRQSTPEPNLFRGFLLTLGLAAPPHTPTQYDNPEVRVWVDPQTGLYYCRGGESFGKTRGGKFTTQGQARQEHFKKANGNTCQ
jgi:general secretion pathway protein A